MNSLGCMLVPRCACVSSFNRNYIFHLSYPYSTKKLYLGNPESPHYRKDIHTYIGTKVPVSTSSRNGTGGKCLV